MATNLDQVYAAGDVTEYRGKVQFSSRVRLRRGLTAVNNAVAAPLFPATRP